METATRRAHDDTPTRKRKSPSFSRSPSPARSRRHALDIADGNRAAAPHSGDDRDFEYRPRLASSRDGPVRGDGRGDEQRFEDKQDYARKELKRLQDARSGGTYIPPARLRALQAQITDRTSTEFQRMAWEALKKSINGLINKVNITNIKALVGDLFQENLIRGRGLFCRSIMRAQAAALPFTPVYAALVCITNTKIPQVGELLVKRLVDMFKKAYKRNDKAVCLSSTMFLAHLVNQQVVHENLVCEILMVLLSNPTDDSVEIAVGLTREVGHHLEEFNLAVATLVFDQFREILQDADIDKRTQYMIEVLFQVRKDRYKDNPAIRDELDLVDEEDLIVHEISTDSKLDTEPSLNVFREDPEYEANEEAYKKLRAEILGEDSDSDAESGSDESEQEDEEMALEQAQVDIKDRTNTDLTNLRRTIYLTINSSADFEEAVHKLVKINLPQGMEGELPSMIIETCSQRPTYERFYGLIGERFAKLNRLWRELFEKEFVERYESVHRLETAKLRNVAKFFGHLVSSEAIGWHVLSAVRMNEQESTSSSRIFVKILFEDIVEAIGLKKLAEKLRSDAVAPFLLGVFPTDNPRSTRFSVNYFTSIGMGALTEGMREFLQNVPPPAALAAPPRSRSGSFSSYTGSSYSSRSRSRSRSYSSRSRSRSYYSGSRSRSRSRSYFSSRSRSRSVSRSRAARPDSRSRSRSYSSRGRSPARGRSYTRSVSRSRSRSRDGPTNRSRRERSFASSRSRSRSVRHAADRRPRSLTRSRSRSISRTRIRSRPRSPRAGSDRRPRSISRSRSPVRSASLNRDRRPRSYTRSRSRSPISRAPAARESSVRRGTGRRNYSRTPSPQRPSRRA